ncbi:MAG TPA: hypothetical protein VM901_07375 [Bdellovibrionota bacterium]|jgi:phage shock protein A|nr:hypothetical protein [Bdellovibrionota bacterium]
MKNFICALSVLMPLASYAGVPQRYTSCAKRVKINEPKNSGGYYFDKDCTTIFVAPAAVSKMEVTSFASQINAEQCGVIKSFDRSYTQEAQNIEALAKRSGIDPKVIKAKEDQIRRNQSEINRLDGQLSQVDPAMAILDAQLTELKARRDALVAQNTSSPSATLQRQIRSLERDISDLEERRSRVNMAAAQLRASKNSLTSQNATLNEEIQASLAGNPEIANRRAALAETLMEHLNTWGKKDGALATVLFVNKHNELAQEFRRMNPDPSLDIQKLPVQVSLNLAVHALNKIELPAAIETSPMPGVVAKFQGSEVDPSSGKFFSESMSASVKLSLIGACKVLERGVQGNTALVNEANSQLIANATYEYFLQTGFRVEVRYNKSEVLRKIAESKTSGGLFSSSSSRKLVESADFKELVEVEASTDDPLLNDKMDALATDMRAQVLTRALNDLSKAYVYFDAKESVGRLPAPGAAAPEIANGVRKMCPHLYCQVGAFVLDVGHKLFGSTRESEEYLRTVNERITDRYDYKRVLPYYGTFSFKP